MTDPMWESALAALRDDPAIMRQIVELAAVSATTTEDIARACAHVVVALSPLCPICLDTGHVCENHPGKVWDDPRGCSCGAGIPCPACCDPMPEDGSTSIVMAFTPRHLRPK